MRLSRNGRVLATARIGHGRTAIQPEIVVTGPKTAVAFLRPFDGSANLYRSETIDGGQTWTPPAQLTDVANPGSPVAALLLSDGRILMAANNDASSAQSLSLMVSRDRGRHWTTLYDIEKSGPEKRRAVRYPDLESLATGEILLTYSTYSRGAIRGQVFNEAWLNSRE